MRFACSSTDSSPDSLPVSASSTLYGKSFPLSASAKVS